MDTIKDIIDKNILKKYNTEEESTNTNEVEKDLIISKLTNGNLLEILKKNQVQQLEKINNTYNEIVERINSEKPDINDEFYDKLIQLPPLEILDIISNLLKISSENKNKLFVPFYSILETIMFKLINTTGLIELKSFFIKASKQKDIGIDIIYNFIRVCVLNRECQLDSENMKYLMEIIEDKNNEKKEESKIILCGMYVSDYLLKLHNKKRNESIQLSKEVKEEFINLLNNVVGRKIQKIEDLTIREIKLLFDELISIKFNETKEGVNGNFLNTGPFLQIIISLTENSGIKDNTTIEKLFNRDNQKDIAISDYQDKLNNFDHIEIANDTKIDSVKTFLEILKLKKSDFGKNGFKTFFAAFPNHGVTIVIDISKSYDKFIENNKDIIKDIIMIDSSKAVNLIMNNGMLKFSDSNTQDFIKKIPVPNIEYQENGTCWANACCANTALLNNYKSFNEIVQKNEKDEVIGLQEGVQENIINETSEYFLSNVKKIEDKNEYEKTYTDQSITIKTNFSSNQAFQNINYMYKARKNKLKKLEQEIKSLQKEEKYIIREHKHNRSNRHNEINDQIKQYEQRLNKLKQNIERIKRGPLIMYKSKHHKFKFLRSIIGNNYKELKFNKKLEKKTTKLLDSFKKRINTEHTRNSITY